MSHIICIFFDWLLLLWRLSILLVNTVGTHMETLSPVPSHIIMYRAGREIRGVRIFWKHLIKHSCTFHLLFSAVWCCRFSGRE